MLKPEHRGALKPITVGVLAVTALAVTMVVVWQLRQRRGTDSSDIASKRSSGTSTSEIAIIPVDRNYQPPADDGYVGSQACVECHGEITEAYTSHPMAHSIATVADAEDIENYDKTTFEAVDRTYQVKREAGKVTHYEVLKDGSQNELYRQGESVQFAVGAGRKGRSYIVNRDGILFESPITWYAEAAKWDLSPGYDHEDHDRFERRINANCLFCHAGRVAHTSRSDPNRFKADPIVEASISCERCHGPARNHVAFHRDAAPADNQLVDDISTLR